MKNSLLQELFAALPEGKTGEIAWELLEASSLGDVFSAMANTPQNPLYHAEGDVWSHTKLVCRALVREEEYQRAELNERCMLFLAALLHDVGKISCTRLQEGVLVSPHHAASGALIARALLWKRGIGGSPALQDFRETVCLLIKYHSFPPYALFEEDAQRKILKIASCGQTAPSFSLKKLCLLERADILGRICPDQEESLERVELCRMLAREQECLEGQYAFADNYSRRAYFRGQTSFKDQVFFDEGRNDVILLCGLPGTGKDFWIKKNVSEMEMISLDEIRKSLGVSATQPQGQVISQAVNRAKALLRKGEPFVWNATNITADLRRKNVALFEQYGARVKTVFLETDWAEGQRRNRSRDAVVPDAALERMLSKLEPPLPYECHTVVWQTT